MKIFQNCRSGTPRCDVCVAPFWLRLVHWFTNSWPSKLTSNLKFIFVSYFLGTETGSECTRTNLPNIQDKYRVFQNKGSQHYCIVLTMREFLCSRRGSTVFCVPCGFCSGGRQNMRTRLTCNMYSLEEGVFFVKSYYSTQKNIKGKFFVYTENNLMSRTLGLYEEQFNVPRHKWPSKSVIIT